MLIAAACDNAFVEHYAAMLHSAWVHNKHAHFVLLDVGISSEKQKSLLAFAREKISI